MAYVAQGNALRTLLMILIMMHMLLLNAYFCIML